MQSLSPGEDAEWREGHDNEAHPPSPPNERNSHSSHEDLNCPSELDPSH